MACDNQWSTPSTSTLRMPSGPAGEWASITASTLSVVRKLWTARRPRWVESLRRLAKRRSAEPPSMINPRHPPSSQSSRVFDSR